MSGLEQEIGLSCSAHANNGVGLVGDSRESAFPFNQFGQIHADCVGQSLLDDSLHRLSFVIKNTIRIFSLCIRTNNAFLYLLSRINVATAYNTHFASYPEAGLRRIPLYFLDNGNFLILAT